MTYSGPDTNSASLLNILAKDIATYSSLKGRLAAADGDRDKAIQAWCESSTDDQAVKLRAAIEAAEAKLTSLAESAVVSETLSDDEKAALSKQLDALTEPIRARRKAIATMAEAFNVDPAGVSAALEEMGDPTKSGKGRKPGTVGSSLPRVSHSLAVWGGDIKEDDPMHFDTFSQAATKLSAEVKDIQLAFAAAAGVSHEAIKDVKTSVAFSFQPAENRPMYYFVSTPKENKKPGRKPKTDSTPTAPVEA